MSMWQTVSVRFTKEFPDGTLKRVTEKYLVNTSSFTETEERIYKEVGEFIRGEFIVKAISTTTYADIFQYEDSEKWFKSVVSYTTEDDNSKEKKVRNTFLVTAPTVKEAYARIEDSLKGLMSVFEICSISETNIVDVMPYKPEENEKKTKEKVKNAE
jgi:hypothetical protein